MGPEATTLAAATVTQAAAAVGVRAAVRIAEAEEVGAGGVVEVDAAVGKGGVDGKYRGANGVGKKRNGWGYKIVCVVSMAIWFAMSRRLMWTPRPTYFFWTVWCCDVHYYFWGLTNGRNSK